MSATDQERRVVVRAAVRSDIGRTRTRNEDSYLLRDPLFVVADGMGGHRGGNVASRMSVDALGEATLPEEGTFDAVVEAMKRANREVHARGEADRNLTGMGTTTTAFVVEGDKGFVAHVGDSRAYLLRDGELQQLTTDHTLVQRMVTEGRIAAEEAERHPARNILTRSLGQEGELDVDTLTLDLHPGDRVLLCSDGLSGMLDEDAIREVLAAERDPQRACDRLVDMANEAGGDDNITAMVLDIVRVGDGPPVGQAVHAPGGVPAEDAAPPAGEDAEPAPGAGHRAPRSWRRRAAWWTAGVLVLVVAAGVGVRLYVDRQWYVGESNGYVAVYNGIPASVVGFDLSHPVSQTAIPAAQAERLQPWQDLKDGIPARSRADADGLVQRIGQDVGVSPYPSAGASPSATSTPSSSP